MAKIMKLVDGMIDCLCVCSGIKSFYHMFKSSRPTVVILAPVEHRDNNTPLSENFIKKKWKDDCRGRTNLKVYSSLELS